MLSPNYAALINMLQDEFRNVLTPGAFEFLKYFLGSNEQPAAANQTSIIELFKNQLPLEELSK